MVKNWWLCCYGEELTVLRAHTLQWAQTACAHEQRGVVNFHSLLKSQNQGTSRKTTQSPRGPHLKGGIHVRQWEKTTWASRSSFVVVLLSSFTFHLLPTPTTAPKDQFYCQDCSLTWCFQTELHSSSVAGSPMSPLIKVHWVQQMSVYGQSLFSPCKASWQLSISMLQKWVLNLNTTLVHSTLWGTALESLELQPHSDFHSAGFARLWTQLELEEPSCLSVLGLSNGSLHFSEKQTGPPPSKQPQHSLVLLISQVAVTSWQAQPHGVMHRKKTTAGDSSSYSVCPHLGPHSHISESQQQLSGSSKHAAAGSSNGHNCMVM